jgi:hypothetical protein
MTTVPWSATQPSEDAPEVRERELVRFQERLLGRVAVGPVERAPTRHAPHAEHLELHPFVAEIRHRLVPVDLGFAAPRVALRHERLPPCQAQRRLPLLDVPSHRRLGDLVPRSLLPEPHVDPMRRVPLFPRRLPVRLQDRVDEVDHRLDPGPRALPWHLHGRHRVVQRLAHQPTMHPQLPRDPLDRSDPELIFPSDLLE